LNGLGCLVAWNNEATISNCSATGLVTGQGYLGGVGGLAGGNGGTISHCSFTGVVTAQHAWDTIGGLVGGNTGTILNSFSDGSFVGGDCIGGLVSWNHNGVISGCYSTGSISGRMRPGGLVSHNDNGTIKNCYSMCSVDGWEGSGGLIGYNENGSILNCYSTGLVDGYSPFGGLVGYNRDGMVDFSFWDMDTSGLSFSDGGTGLSTWDMYEKKTFLDAGWDFDNIWWIDEWRNYPILKWQLPPTPPVADAGADQTLFAFGKDLVEVQLDGTNSYDKYDDALEYFWFDDANELIATGAEPNVVLPVGKHVIDLIVNDGIEDSEPDSCTITVIEPVEMTGRMLPGVINLKVNRDQINGRIEFAGKEMPVLDPNEPMLLLVGDAEIQAAEQKLVYCEEEIAWYLMGSFDSAAVIENLPLNTTAKRSLTVPPAEAEITLVARFEAGQWVYGTDMVKVK